MTENLAPGGSARQTGLPRKHIIAVGVASVVVGMGFGRFSYGVVLPAMTEDVIGSYGRAGLLGTLNLGAYLAGVLVLSGVATQVQPVRLLWAGLAGVCAGLFTLAAAPNFGVLVLGMMLVGFATAGTWIQVTAIVSSVADDARRGMAMGVVVAGPGIGILLAGQLASGVRTVVGSGAWRPVWAIEAAIGVAVLLWSFVLRRMPRLENPHSGVGWPLVRRIPGWVRLIVSYGAFGLGYTIFYTYLVAMLEDDAGFAPSEAALMYSLVGLASIVGGMLIGRISDQLGRRRALATCYAVLAVCTAGVLLGVQPWVGISVALFGLFLNGVGAVVAATVGDHLDGGSVAAAFGAVTIAMGAMQMVGPNLGGWIAEQAGSFAPSFLLAAGALGVSAVTALTLPRDV